MIELFYDDVPPSLNRLGSRGNHWAVTNAKRRWQDIFATLLLPHPRSRFERIHATAVLRFPVRRRRDEGNFRWLLEKALGDALVTGGWLLDDDAGRFTFGTVSFEANPGPPRTNVHIVEIGASEC